jgi:hypothetical protein
MHSDVQVISKPFFSSAHRIVLETTHPNPSTRNNFKMADAGAPPFNDEDDDMETYLSPSQASDLARTCLNEGLSPAGLLLRFQKGPNLKVTQKPFPHIHGNMQSTLLCHV